MRKPYLLFFAVFVSSCAVGITAHAMAGHKERAYLIKETVTVRDLPKDAGDVRIWVAYPKSGIWQKVYGPKIDSRMDKKIVPDKRYGNEFIYLTAEGGNVPFPAKVSLSYKVLRKEAEAVFYSLPGGNDLSAETHIPVTGGIKKLAEEITKGKTGTAEEAKAVYDYVIDNLVYSKDEPAVCGAGDTLTALEYKKGNCSNYHTLFISLVRSLGIPARFQIGFPVPEDKTEGDICGYHCWAEFYLAGAGWVPVDISEADKHPEKREYFFGHLDENRVCLTSGRDILPEYAQAGKPLNFFVFAYAEVNGRRYKYIDVKLRFKELQV